MSTPVLFKYPLDLTGTATTNLVQGELVSIPRTTSRHFAPQYGPFYANSVILTTVPANVQLVKGVDYECLYLYDYATKKTGQSVTAVISVINPAIHGQLRYDYQVVGGEFSTSVSAIQLLIENLELDNRAIAWDDILDLPVTFPPSPHFHHVGDWYGFDSLVEAVNALSAAITTGSEDLYDQLNARFDAILQSFLNQQLQIANLQAAVTALQQQDITHTSTIANLQSQITALLASTNNYVKFTELSVNTTVAINRRYLVVNNITVKLPNTTGLNIGDSVEFEMGSSVFPIFTVFTPATHRLRRFGALDTSVTYDGIRACLRFIYMGGSIWEVRI